MAIQYCNYIHYRPNGDPFYVGKATINTKHRNNRAFMFSHRNNLHKKIVSKYGKENIKVYVFMCETEREALDNEVLHIAQFRKEGYFLANFTDGGEGMSGYTPSDETRKKWSECRKGRKASEETRKKLSAARKGKPSPILGRKHTEEAKANMSAFQKGRVKSEEHKRKISEAHKGKIQLPHSEEHKAKISAALKGRKMPEGALAKAWETRRARLISKEN